MSKQTLKDIDQVTETLGLNPGAGDSDFRAIDRIKRDYLAAQSDRLDTALAVHHLATALGVRLGANMTDAQAIRACCAEVDKLKQAQRTLEILQRETTGGRWDVGSNGVGIAAKGWNGNFYEIKGSSIGDALANLAEAIRQ